MATAADLARSRRKKKRFESLNSTFKGKAVFLSAAFVGSVFIFLAEPVNSPFALGVLGPIVMMIIYIIMGLAGYIEIADNESYADSIYYMGFILTLVSLAAALVYLRNENPQLGLLVSKFGLALLTTILGLCVRVAMVNFKIAGNDARRTADERLTHAIDRFTNDIELTCEKVELLLSGSLDQVQFTATEVAKATTQAANTIQEQALQTSKQTQELHEGAEKQWKETIESLTTNLNSAITNATEFSIERLKALNEKIHQEMDSFHIPRDIFTSKLEPPMTDLQAAVGNFARNMEGSEKQWKDTIENLTTNLNSATTNATEFSIARLKALNEKIHQEMDSFHIPRDIFTSKLEPALTNLQATVGNFSTNMDQLVAASTGHEVIKDRFDDLSSALDYSAETFKALQTNAETLMSSYNNLELLGERYGQLSTQLEKSAQSLNQWDSAVDDSVIVLKDGANAGRLSIGSLTQEIEDLVRISKDHSERISELAARIATDAEAGQKALNTVQDNLIESSRVIVKNLKT